MSRVVPLVVLAACTPAPEPRSCATDPAAEPIVAPTATSPGEAPPECVLPALLDLAGVPELGRPVGADTAVVFELDGDEIVGKIVVDPAAAEGALRLWQELVWRIPTNQRAQLVELELFTDDGLAGWADNVGTGNHIGRYGPSLHLHVDNLVDDSPDTCAPLSGHRGTYDWTLVHELGHLRQYADGTVDAFVERFGTATGDGEGYPEEGTPVLDGDFVTSYAERAGGDEDAAESWTTYVMLDELPVGDSVAAQKVRFFDGVPGYRELRRAIRVSEPGGGGVEVPDAPLRDYDLVVRNPDWLVGTWEGAGPEGTVRYEIAADDLVFTASVEAGAVPLRYSALRDGGALATIEVVESSEDFHLLQIAYGEAGWSEGFHLRGDGALVEREHFGEVSLARVP